MGSGGAVLAGPVELGGVLEACAPPFFAQYRKEIRKRNNIKVSPIFQTFRRH